MEIYPYENTIFRKYVELSVVFKFYTCNPFQPTFQEYSIYALAPRHEKHKKKNVEQGLRLRGTTKHLNTTNQVHVYGKSSVCFLYPIKKLVVF